MAIRRCDAGEHTFDDSQHSHCPYCRKTRLTVTPGPPDDDDIPPVVPGWVDPGKTMPAPNPSPPWPSGPAPKTRLVFGGVDAGGKTVDFGEVMPVVAWLVVVKGHGLGRDVRVTPGMNSIGRDKGDILLNFGDNAISREKHAFIAYDADGNGFLLAHGEGKSLTKVNDKMVMGSQEIRPYDRIRMGETEMLFVPLCGEHFSWINPTTGKT